MFWKAKAEKDDTETRALKRKIEDLEKDIRTLEHRKELEKLELQGLVKIKEEKMAIELAKKQNELAAKYQDKTQELQTQYHDKVVAMLEKHAEQFQATYREIMARLPNVNMAIDKKVR